MRQTTASINPLPFFLNLACCAALLTLSACSTTSSAPASPQAACESDGAVSGAWKQFRMTQLGPSWVSLRFECDCSYRSTAQLLWMRISESGTYVVSGSEIIFQRASGAETRWPFRLEGETLFLTEAKDEERAYRRSQRIVCD